MVRLRLSFDTLAMRGSWTRPLGPIVLATVALRLPALDTPLTGDEPGFLHIARSWGRGGHLYDELFVDRPQLLLLFYRLIAALPEPVVGLRVAAIVCWSVLAACAYQLAHRLRSGDGPVAAALVILAGAFGPFLPVSPTNELLAATTSALAIAVLTGPWRPLRGAFAAGLLAGSAGLFKQSGIDAAVIGAIVLAAVALRSRDRASVTRCAGFLVGGLVAVAASFAHGLHVGWHYYYIAMYGFRAEYVSILAIGPAVLVRRLADSLAHAASLLTPLVMLAVLASIPRCSSVASRGGLLTRRFVVGWLAIVVGALLFGGQYWQAYYIALIAPVAVLGAGVRALHERWSQGVAVFAIAVLGTSISLQLVPPVRRPVAFDGAIHHDATVAASSFVARRTTAQDRVQGLWRSGEVNALADRPSAHRYLWTELLLLDPKAMDQLADMIEGPTAPRYVVAKEDFLAFPAGARVAAAVCERYGIVASVEGIYVLRDERRSPSSAGIEALESSEASRPCPASWINAIRELQRAGPA